MGAAKSRTGPRSVEIVKDNEVLQENENNDIVRLICDGIDVHKKVLMTAAITNPSTLKAVYYIKKFSTLNADISSMANWFKQHGVTDVVMESTGKYWIPIRNMRDLCRYLMKLTYIRTSEKNRFQNSMTIAQIRLDSVFSDPFGATASHIMDYILSTPKDQVSKDDIFKLIDHRVIYMTHYA